jgi:hypothetical protein
MSEAGVIGLSRRRSRSEADRLVSEFEQSGMKRIAFCRAHGVSAHTLDYYRRMRRGEADVTPQLLPVELVETSARGSSPGLWQGVGLRVELANGRRIVVEEGFSASLLKSVVAALEG